MYNMKKCSKWYTLRGEKMNCFLFLGLTEVEVKNIVSTFCVEETVAKSKEIYKSGFIGILLSGQATICRLGDTGNAVTIRNIKRNDVFGAAGIFGEWKKGKSQITTRTDCKVLYISEEALKSIFEKYPQVAVNYITFLSDRIRFLNRRIDAFSAGSTVQKLYEYLVSVSVDGTANLDFGLAELARRLKMGRSSLYRGLEVLLKNGLVERCKNTYQIK